MARILYTFAVYLLTPVVLLGLAWRGLRTRAYWQRWPERFGWVRGAGAEPVWVHAASVGEVQAALPLIRALRQRLADRPLLVTTMTPTGSAHVRSVLGNDVAHVYAPLDLPGAARRFLRRTRPSLGLIMETELWPHLYAQARAHGVPLLLVNARLSARSSRTYRRFSTLVRHTLSQLAAIAAQTEADAERFRQLGAAPAKVRTVGNIKFDLALPDQLMSAGRMLRAELGRYRPVWIAASTHDGEDEQVLAAHRQLSADRPDLLLILVPRHPERFDRVAALCMEQGFRVARRSRGEPAGGAEVYLGDTMGELTLLYAAADAAFVGGSMVPVGGHNLLEPAALGLAPASGPHLFNFQQIAELLTEADALFLARGPAELAARIGRLLDQPAQRHAAGERARGVVDANRGALDRTLALIDQYLPSA